MVNWDGKSNCKIVQITVHNADAAIGIKCEGLDKKLLTFGEWKANSICFYSSATTAGYLKRFLVCYR